MDKITQAAVIDIVNYSKDVCESYRSVLGDVVDKYFTQVCDSALAKYLKEQFCSTERSAVTKAHDEAHRMMEVLAEEAAGDEYLPLVNDDDEYRYATLRKDLEDHGVVAEYYLVSSIKVRVASVDDLYKVRDAVDRDLCIDYIDGQRALVIGRGGC